MYRILQQPARIERYFGTAEAKKQSLKPLNREHTYLTLGESSSRVEVPAGNSSRLQVQIQSAICTVQKCKT